MDETTPAALAITRATADDVARLAAFLFATELGTTYFPTLATCASALENGIAHDEVFALYAPDGEAAALLWFQQEGAFYRYPYLHIIVVGNAWQGQGLGRKLLDFYEERICCDRLRTKSFLVVDEANERARAVYARRGYEQVGRLPGLFRRGVNELLLVKDVVRPRR